MRRAIAVAITSIAVLSGCGSASTTTVTQTETSGTNASHSSSGGAGLSSTAATATSAGGSKTTSTNSSGGASPSQLVVHLADFKSPSTNIGCMVFTSEARCDIQSRSWTPGARPKGCSTGLNYGQGLLVLNAGVGRLVCASDTALDPAARVLHYSVDTVVGPFRCESRVTGMTCIDGHTGHGFFLSRQSYRLF